MKGCSNMFCPECGKTVEEGVVFCPNCGAKVIDTLQAVSPVVKSIGKPMGVMFIVILTAFMGITTMIGGVFLNIIGYGGLGIVGEIPYGGGLFGGAIAEAKEGVKWGLFGLGLAGYFLLFFGIFNMTAAYGIWSLVEWGRKLAVVLYILGIPLSLLSLIVMRLTIGLVILELIWIAVLVAIILYLSKPDVRRLFQ
jgi:DNA-directed RNA polymerase subunit RPC12/RpoP